MQAEPTQSFISSKKDKSPPSSYRQQETSKLSPPTISSETSLNETNKLYSIETRHDY